MGGRRPVGRARVRIGVRGRIGGRVERSTGGTAPWFGFLIVVFGCSPRELLPGRGHAGARIFLGLGLAPLR